VSTALTGLTTGAAGKKCIRPDEGIEPVLMCRVADHVDPGLLTIKYKQELFYLYSKYE
jgi:hypothetical protein